MTTPTGVEGAAALAEFRAPIDDVRSVALSTHDIAVALARGRGIDICDALIIAAATEGGCTRLYSEDLQDGRRFGDCEIVDPFRGADPA